MSTAEDALGEGEMLVGKAREEVEVDVAGMEEDVRMAAGAGARAVFVPAFFFFLSGIVGGIYRWRKRRDEAKKRE